jgi:hypothetical protein
MSARCRSAIIAIATLALVAAGCGQGQQRAGDGEGGAASPRPTYGSGPSAPGSGVVSGVPTGNNANPPARARSNAK